MQQRDSGKGKGQDRYLAPEDADGLAKPKAPEASVTERASPLVPWWERPERDRAWRWQRRYQAVTTAVTTTVSRGRFGLEATD